MENGQELKETLAKSIKDRRNARGWSLEKLADIVGISRNSINEIELANNFASPDTLVKLAKAFETEVYELLKPDDVLPDKAADIIEKYCDSVKKNADKTKNDYLKKLKKYS